jgi:hypothetical protein
MKSQPINSVVSFDDGECRVIHLARSSDSYQMISQLYSNSVLEIFIEGSTCILTVIQRGTTLACTTFNLKTLRVAPTGCALDRINMAIIRNDIYNTL